MTEYIDPNSGRASQPGGYAAAIVAVESDEAGQAPETDPTYDAAIEHQAAPQGDQPQSEGDNASESGTTEQDVQDGDAPEQQSGGDEQPEPEPEAPEQSEESGESSDAASTDYSELLAGTVPTVQKYMDDNPGEADAVKMAEIDKAAADEREPRKGIVEYGD